MSTTATIMADVRVNSIVELLAAESPVRLDALRQRYPEQEQILRAGRILGARRSGPNDRIYCELCNAGLDAAERQLMRLLRVLPTRLARAKKLRLIASIVTSLTSAGVLAAVFAGAAPAARVAATVAFVAAVSSLLAQYLEVPLGGEGTIANHLEELVGLEVRLREIKARLAEAELEGQEPTSDGHGTTCRDIAGSVNELAAQIRRIQLFAGSL